MKKKRKKKKKKGNQKRRKQENSCVHCQTVAGGVFFNPPHLVHPNDSFAKEGLAAVCFNQSADPHAPCGTVRRRKNQRGICAHRALYPAPKRTHAWQLTGVADGEDGDGDVP